jgi:cellulose biosynthesis protein BcsQ
MDGPLRLGTEACTVMLASDLVVLPVVPEDRAAFEVKALVREVVTRLGGEHS